MLRLAFLGFSALILGACGTAPLTLTPLAIDERFDARYEGSLQLFDAEGLSAHPTASPSAGLGAREQMLCRATWIELRTEEARAWLPGLATPPPPPSEVLSEGATRHWSPTGVVTYSAEASGVLRGPRVPVLGMALGRVAAPALRVALEQLASTARVIAIAEGELERGESTALAITSERAFIRSLRLASAADSIHVQDVEIDCFPYGAELLLRWSATASGSSLGLAWTASSWMPAPGIVVEPYGGIEAPALVRHRVEAEAPFRVAEDALILASLPGAQPGTVQLLCVELHEAPRALAQR
ncbi:MAG: hypothetical protein JNM84_27810 [Planctomycetes bacterium]|nr:hypothetical protein [Planctomycetota bacterium]